MTTPAAQPTTPVAAAQDLRTCILGGENATKNATMAAVAVAVAAVTLVFFAEIQTFLWSGLILATIIAGSVALVELAGTHFAGNPTVDSLHAVVDRGVALAENAFVSMRSFLAGAMASVPAGTGALAAQTVTNLTTNTTTTN